MAFFLQAYIQGIVCERMQRFKSGLKLINCLISLIYVVVVRQIPIRYKWLSNCIKPLINQNIQSPLLTKLFKIAVYDNLITNNK